MHLDEHSDTPFYRQLEAQLREGIESGTYPTGSRLPSIRGLASDLGCARNTVEQAYHLLVQEGYVASRPGSGYVVQNVTYLQPDASAPSCAVLLGGPRRKARYDFTYGNLEPGTFPAAAWRAITDDILLSVEAAGCDAYNDPFGEESLRAAIAWRLVTQRDIDCTPEQIVVQGGTQTSVQNLLTLFDAARDTVAMEDPGYDGVRSVIERARFAIKPCRVTDDVRVFLSDLESSGARLAYLTPFEPVPHLPHHADRCARARARVGRGRRRLHPRGRLLPRLPLPGALAGAFGLHGRPGPRHLHGHVLEIALPRPAHELPRAAHAPP